ncbi:MAG UNVERIFIED_CONTAM: DUF6508 domain-containing protein [Paenibacillus polymyxa]|jgi:hypothetical protein
MKHTTEQFDALIAFLPIFEKEGFRFSTPSEPRQNENGYWSMPYTILSDEGLAFVQACYDNDWIVNYDWGTYAQTDEAQQLRDDPSALSEATEDQVSKVLTIVVRQERFCDGSLSLAHESGFLTGILRRLEQLSSEQTIGG